MVKQVFPAPMVTISLDHYNKLTADAADSFVYQKSMWEHIDKYRTSLSTINEIRNQIRESKLIFTAQELEDIIYAKENEPKHYGTE